MFDFSVYYMYLQYFDSVGWQWSNYSIIYEGAGKYGER